MQISYWRHNYPLDPTSNREQWDSRSSTAFPWLFRLVKRKHWHRDSSNMSIPEHVWSYIRKVLRYSCIYLTNIFLSKKNLLLVSSLSTTSVSVIFVSMSPFLTFSPLFFWKIGSFFESYFFCFSPQCLLQKLHFPDNCIYWMYLSVVACSCVIKRLEIQCHQKTSIYSSLMSLQVGCHSIELGWPRSWLQTAFWSGPHVTILSLSQIPGKSSSKGQTKPHKHI